MRLANAVHEQKGWVIGEIAHDFQLLDVWALPVEGEREEFGAFLETMTALDPTESKLSVTYALLWVRLRLGALLGWDDPTKVRSIPGSNETSLRERLPERLRATDAPKLFGGFSPLYRTDDEAAAEISNETVHGVVHLGWVEQENGRYRGHLAVYVKPRGALGELYLKLITPFRHLIVYPALIRRVGRAWEKGRA